MEINSCRQQMTAYDMPVSVLCFDGAEWLCRHYSNVYELITKSLPQLLPLMRMCDVAESLVDGDESSDYDKFCSLCKAFPDLAGNRAYALAHALLRELFDCDLEINQQNAPLIWSAYSGDGLGFSGAELAARVGVGEIFVPFGAACADGFDTYFMLDVNAELENLRGNAHTVEDIDALVRERCKQMKRAGAGLAFVRVSDDFDFVKPSPYGVSMALNASELSQVDKNALLVQVLRSTSRALSDNDFSLVVFARPSERLTKTLEYLRDSVGLCNILLCAERVYPSELEAFLLSLPPDILRRVTPSNVGGECAEDALKNYACRFAIGKLPHLGLLAGGEGLANVADQLDFRRALSEFVSQEQIKQICVNNIHKATGGRI